MESLELSTSIEYYVPHLMILPTQHFVLAEVNDLRLTTMLERERVLKKC